MVSPVNPCDSFNTYQVYGSLRFHFCETSGSHIGMTPPVKVANLWDSHCFTMEWPHLWRWQTCETSDKSRAFLDSIVSSFEILVKVDPATCFTSLKSLRISQFEISQLPLRIPPWTPCEGWTSNLLFFLGFLEILVKVETATCFHHWDILPWIPIRISQSEIGW